MTVSEVYRKLGEVRSAKLSVELLLDRLRALDAMKTSIRSIMPKEVDVQTSRGTSRLEDIIVEIDEKEELLQRRVHWYMDAVESVKSLILTVEKDTARQILVKRYIDCKKWEIIALETGYTVEHIQRIKRKAVQEIARRPQ